jgi:hypothetical protein
MNTITKREIISKYMAKPEYHLNTCAAYYREMHENGYYETVLHFLLHGDSVIGKQGFTYDTILRELTTCEAASFVDHRGEYAGTHRTYKYQGQPVHYETRYSLFS